MVSPFWLVRLTLFWLVLFSGCQLPVTETKVPDTTYFPLETGRYIVYEVEEQQYSPNAAPVYRTYQLKEVVSTAYTNVTGETAYRLIRYRRLSEAQPWQADSIWAARILTNEAIRTENGRDFVQLVFPLTNLLTWDSNHRTGLGTNNLTARNVGKPYRVLAKPFDETVTVTGQTDSTLISLTKHVDVYARQVGLIYKERVNLQFCTASPACTGRSQIDYGSQQIYRIQSYGFD